MSKAWYQVALACFAGSGLLAGVEGGMQLAYPGQSLTRELTAIALLGTWSVTALVLIGMWIGSRLQAARGRTNVPSPGTAFCVGIAVGAVPVLAALIERGSPGGLGPVPSPALAGVLALGLLVAAPRLGRSLRPGRLAAPLVLLLGVFLAASPFLPSGLALGGEPPAYEPVDGDPRPVPQGPDLILISIDTLRADAILGPDGARVPNLDRMRDEGLWADYALSSSNQTLPGHVGMLSGLDAMQHGVRSNSDDPRRDIPMLAEHLYVAGWATGGVVSNGLLTRMLGFERGYEVYDDDLVYLSMIARGMLREVGRRTWLGWLLPDHRIEQLMRALRVGLLQRKEDRRASGVVLGEHVTERALGQIDAFAAQSRPYFLMVHYFDAHAPYLAPPEYREKRTAGLDPPGPKWFAPGEGDRAKQGFEDLKRAVEQREPGAAEAARWYHHIYLESVSWVDTCIGRIRERAEATGRPTVILFTSDHGEHFGEHDLLEHANSLYEENLRVPFVLWGAGVPRAGRVPGAVQLRDVAPTLLDLAGLRVDGLQGRVVHRGIREAPHIAVDEKRVTARWQGWKWIGAWDPEQKVSARELYHVDSDGVESSNLLGKNQPPPELIEFLNDSLAADTWRPRSGAIPAGVAAALNEMGYVDGDEDSGDPQ